MERPRAFSLDDRICSRYYRPRRGSTANTSSKHAPNAKIAILYQNDDFGKDYLAGFKDVLGDKHDEMIVKEASYEVTDPTVDRRSSRCRRRAPIRSPDAGDAEIRRPGHPQGLRTRLEADAFPLTHRVVGLGGAGAGRSREVGRHRISRGYQKDPSIRLEERSPASINGAISCRDTCPRPTPPTATSPGMSAHVLVQVLKQCGNDLSRENIMRQAANLHDLKLPRLSRASRSTPARRTTRVKSMRSCASTASAGCD